MFILCNSMLSLLLICLQGLMVYLKRRCTITDEILLPLLGRAGLKISLAQWWVYLPFAFGLCKLQLNKNWLNNYLWFELSNFQNVSFHCLVGQRILLSAISWDDFKVGTTFVFLSWPWVSFKWWAKLWSFICFKPRMGFVVDNCEILGPSIHRLNRFPCSCDRQLVYQNMSNFWVNILKKAKRVEQNEWFWAKACYHVF